VTEQAPPNTRLKLTAPAVRGRIPFVTPFAQEYAACRCEWGIEGLSALTPADVTIIVDVFTFTTCVDVALAAGAAILPYRWDDATAADYAARHKAELAGRRRQARYSLAPCIGGLVSPLESSGAVSPADVAGAGNGQPMVEFHL